MRRRQFLQSSGLVSVAALPVFGGSARSANANGAPGGKDRATAEDSIDTCRVWQFHDRWSFDQLDGLELRQGEAEWQQDAVFDEPNIGALSAWPTVYFDAATDRWRMLYSAGWKPYQLMIADSADGRHWTPLAHPDIDVGDARRAPHHLFTLPGGSGGGVYIDPMAADGFPFKVFVHQRGEVIRKRAIADPTHRWHAIAKDEGAKKYLVEDFTLVSSDGIHWQPRRDLVWSGRDWHPEPPIFGFYNRHSRRHTMTVRPGWGDRRVCLQSTNDFHDWSGPELVLQPDAIDEALIEHYGMPVFRYGDGYVGLLWIFHPQSDDPTRGFNRFVGPIDCQLAFSRDGVRFTRGVRQPLITRNQPGQPGCGAIEPSCLVETDDEIRIYSSATRLLHGKGSEAKRQGITDNASILLHTIRKDGLMLLQPTGQTGRLVSKPLVPLEATLSINANASRGNIEYQLLDLESRPVEGFTYETCVPMSDKDSTRFPLRWKNADLAQVRGRIVRLGVRLHSARLYAVHGKIHFIDAQDRWMIEDGKTIAV